MACILNEYWDVNPGFPVTRSRADAHERCLLFFEEQGKSKEHQNRGSDPNSLGVQNVSPLLKKVTWNRIVEINGEVAAGAAST